MSTLMNALEPGAIALIFTAGALLNRRRKPDRLHNRRGQCSCSCGRRSSVDSHSSLRSTDNTTFRDSVGSRFLDRYPFLIEIWYWNLTYWIYQLARAYSAHLVRHDASVYRLAEKHALSILRSEHCLGIDLELRVQHFVLGHAPSLMAILSAIYYSHISVGVCFLVYTYTYLPFGTFAQIRRTIAMDNILAFLLLTAWRCKPPRLLPPAFGYIDILHPTTENNLNTPEYGQILNGTTGVETPSTWNNNPYQLTIAAMPSLHFGTSLFLAVSIIRFSPHRLLRNLAPLWPVCMLITILATANHWVLDAIIGSIVPYFGWKLNSVLNNSLFEAIELWCFSFCRIEKPAMGNHEHLSCVQKSFGHEEDALLA